MIQKSTGWCHNEIGAPANEIMRIFEILVLTPRAEISAPVLGPVITTLRFKSNIVFGICQTKFAKTFPGPIPYPVNITCFCSVFCRRFRGKIFSTLRVEIGLEMPYDHSKSPNSSAVCFVSTTASESDNQTISLWKSKNCPRIRKIPFPAPTKKWLRCGKKTPRS